MSENIKVAVRMKPLINREKDATIYWKAEDKKCVSEIFNKSKQFCFDRVFDCKDTNWHVYSELCSPIVSSAMEGFNGTVFAYGQTASGKTFTMMGEHNDLSDTLGLIHYTIEEIFDRIQTMPEREFLLRVSFIEIYNEKVYDLLSDKKIDLKVLEDKDGIIHVSELQEKIVQTSDQIWEHIRRSQKKRQTGETKMNSVSSRSHYIFRMIIESRLRDKEDSAVNVSQLNLVDLAGSEDMKQAKTTGERQKEGIHINSSLSFLRKVISQLSEEKKYVSFRDSNLTKLLKNSLCGNALIAICCTITPISQKETMRTLEFASGAKNIKVQPKKNEILNDQAMSKKMADEIKKLSKQLEASREQEKKLQVKTEECENLKQQIDQIRANFVSEAVVTKTKATRRETWGGYVDTRKYQFDLFNHRSTFQLPSVPSQLEILEEETEGDTDCLAEENARNRISSLSEISCYRTSISSSRSSVAQTQTHAETQTNFDDLQPNSDIEDAVVLVSEIKSQLIELKSEYEELSEFTTLEKQHLKAENELQTDLEAVRNENFLLRKELDSLRSSQNSTSPVFNKFELKVEGKTSPAKCALPQPNGESKYETDNDSCLLNQSSNTSFNSQKYTSDLIMKEESDTNPNYSTLLDQSAFLTLYDECVENEVVAKMKNEIESFKYDVELKDKQISLLNDKLQIKEQIIMSLKDEIALSQKKGQQILKSMSEISEEVFQYHVSSQTDVMHTPLKNTVSNDCQTSPVHIILCDEYNNLNNFDDLNNSIMKSQRFSNFDSASESKVSSSYTEDRINSLSNENKEEINENSLINQSTQTSQELSGSIDISPVIQPFTNNHIRPVEADCGIQMNCDINTGELTNFSNKPTSKSQEIDNVLLKNYSNDMKIMIDKINQLNDYTIELMRECLKTVCQDEINYFQPFVINYSLETAVKGIESLKHLIMKLELGIKSEISERNNTCEILSRQLESKFEEIAGLTSKVSNAEQALSKKNSEYFASGKKLFELLQKFSQLTFIYHSLNSDQPEKGIDPLNESSNLVIFSQFDSLEYEIIRMEKIFMKLNSCMEENASKIIYLTECLQKSKNELSNLQEAKENVLSQSVQTDELIDSTDTDKKQNALMQDEVQNLLEKIDKLEKKNNDLEQEIADLKAAHSVELDALEMKFEESRFEWTQKTEKLVRDLEEKYEQELTDQQNKFAEEISQTICKQKEEHINQVYALKRENKELLENKIDSENQIIDLKKQLISVNLKFEKEKESDGHVYQKKQDTLIDRFNKKLKKCQENKSYLEGKVQYYLREIEKTKKVKNDLANERNSLQKKYAEDTGRLEIIIDNLKDKLEKVKNQEQIKQNVCSNNCKEIDEKNKKLRYELDQRKAKIISVEANNTRMIQEIKKLKELLSSKTVLPCNCKTNSGSSRGDIPEKFEDYKNKRKNNFDQKNSVAVSEILSYKKGVTHENENLKENDDPNAQALNLENAYLDGGSGIGNWAKCFRLEHIIHKKDKEIDMLTEKVTNLKAELKKMKTRPLIAENETDRKVAVLRSPSSPLPELNEDVTIQTNYLPAFPLGAVPKVKRKHILKEKNERKNAIELRQTTENTRKEGVALDWQYPTYAENISGCGVDDIVKESECKQQ